MINGQLIDSHHRYNMIKLAVEELDNIEVSDFEITSLKQPYTIETLKYFKEKYPDNEITLVIGADNLEELDTWNNYKEILNKYTVIVVRRNDVNIEKLIEEKFKEYKENIIILDNNEDYTSSTMIRNKIKSNEDVSEFLNKKVEEYLKENVNI